MKMLLFLILKVIIEKNKSLSTKVKVKAVCGKNRKNSVNSVNDKSKQNERIKILAEFF